MDGPHVTRRRSSRRPAIHEEPMPALRPSATRRPRSSSRRGGCSTSRSRRRHAGFDSVWTSDHFQPWRHTDGHAPNALGLAGRRGAVATSRVTLGTSVLTPSFRYNPAIVAQAFATLGCLAPGRVILGVGTGESMNEVPVGVDWPEQSERFARLKEAVTLIQALTAPGAEFVDFEGTYYRTHEATVYDKPDQPVPDLHRGVRPGRRAARGPDRRRLHLHQRQGRGAVHRDAPAGARRGGREGRPRRVDDGPDDRDEGLVRPRPATGRWRTRRSGRRSR